MMMEIPHDDYGTYRTPAEQAVMDRLGMIGRIRDHVSRLYDTDRPAIVREVLGDIHPDNFSGVPTETIARILQQLEVV